MHVSVDGHSLSRHGHASFDEVHVDLRAQLHAVAELLLVVCFSTLGLDVLLDGIDLGLVLNEFLLDVVQSIVDLTLQDLVLLRVVLHLVVGNLLLERVAVHVEEPLDQCKAHLLLLELCLQLVRLGELVGHLILHRVDLFLRDVLLSVDSRVEVLNLLKVVLSLLLLYAQPGSRRLRVFQLTLLELQVGLHLSHLSLRWQLVLSSHSLLHVL